MIRVVRRAEPPALTRARTRHLANAAAAYDTHGAPSTELSNCLVGYNPSNAIKKALHHKANYFPLEPGSSACSPPLRPVGASFPISCFDVSSERPMLLDPTIDSFLDHVRWVPFNTRLARRSWTWSPSPLTPRGRATIEILKLAELADDVDMHLAKVVLPSVEVVEQHLEGRRRRQGRPIAGRL